MTPLRPTQHLRIITEEYPGIWQQVDTMRQQRGLSLPQWPAWCFLPLAGAVAVITRGIPDPPPQLLVGPAIGIVGALAAWRVTQGIYRVDPDVFEALWTTPLEGELPTALLYHLPEWCVYIACPTPRALLGERYRLYGWYAHLEWDANTHEQELRLLFDTDIPLGAGLVPLAVHLGEWDLGVAVQRALATSLDNLRVLGAPQLATGLQEHLAEASTQLQALCQPLVSVVLYLCSVAADIRDARGTDRLPKKPQPVRTKRGERLFPPAQPTTWEVAYRLGAPLRQAQQREQAAPPGAEETTASRARPRSHLRRAHWHTFLTGKGRALPRVRWVHPVLVGQQAEIVPTMHPVE